MVTWRTASQPTGVHIGENGFTPGSFYPDGGIVAGRADGTAWLVGTFGEDQFGLTTPVVSYSPATDSWTSHPGIDMSDLTKSWATNSDMNPITAFEYSGDFYIGAMPSGDALMHVYKYNGDGTLTDVASVDPAATLWPSLDQYTVAWNFDYTRFPAAVVGSKAYWMVSAASSASPAPPWPNASGRWLVSYNFTSNAWRAEAQISDIKYQNPVMIFDGRYIYVIGGFFYPNPNELTTEPNLTNGRVQRFDTQGGVGTSFEYVGTLQPGWISAETLENVGLEGVEGATGCYANGKLWILGGWYVKEANETGGTGYQPFAWSVDPVTLQATRETDMLSPSYAGSAFVDTSGNIYTGLGWSGGSFDVGWYTTAPIPSNPNLTGGLDNTTAYFWRPRSA